MNTEAAAYQKAVKDLAKVEAVLTDALDRLAAARAAGDIERITPARMRAQTADREVLAAEDIAYQAQRAYWRAQAQAAELRMVKALAPHISEVDGLWRLAGSLVTHPARNRLIDQMYTDRTVFEPDGSEVPIEFPESLARKRADEEIFASQSGWKMPAKREKVDNNISLSSFGGKISRL